MAGANDSGAKQGGDLLHYLKILPWLKAYAEKAGSAALDWPQDLFDDLTEGGTALNIYELTPNEAGPRIAICGERFFAEGGIDKDRDDAIFVSRIESAAHRPPRKVPSRFEATFVLVRQAALPTQRGSRVGPLFGLQSDRTATPEDIPTKRLCDRLHQTPPAIRRSWQPRRGEAPEGVELLKAYRFGWRDRGLERFRRKLGLGTRMETILDGATTPAQLSLEERTALSSGFGVRLLNEAAVASQSNPDALWAVIDAVGALPLDQARRAIVWEEMVADLPSHQLRQEIAASAEVFREMSSASQVAWERTLGRVLTDVARREDDRELEALIDEAARVTRPLERILAWATAAAVVTDEIAQEDEHSLERTERTPLSERVEPVATSEVQDDAPTGERHEPSTTETPEALSEEEKWLQAEVLGDAALPTRLREVVGGIVVQLDQAQRQGKGGIEDIGVLLEALKSVRRTASEWIDERLNEIDRIRGAQEQGRELIARARTALGGRLEQVLAARPTMRELSEIVELVDIGDAIARVPQWIWGESFHAGLLDPNIRRRARQVAESSMSLGELGKRLLGVLPPPPEALDPDEYLKSELKAAEDLALVLPSVDEATMEWICALVSEGARVDGLLGGAQVAASLAQRVSPEAFRSILESLRSAPSAAEAKAQLLSYERVVHSVEDLLGSAVTVSFEQLVKARAKVQVSAAAVEPDIPYSIVHDYVGTGEQSRTIAPLVFEAIEGEFGRVRIPLVICSGLSRDVNLRVVLVGTPKERVAWPQERGQPEPAELRIRPGEWRGPESREYRYPFEWTVPLRCPTGNRLVLSLALVDADSGETLAPGKRMDWEVRQSPDVTFDWPAAVDVGHVVEHPIGPQKHASVLWQRLKAGNSFAVLAPRRFGKTTLISHLAKRSGDDGVLALGPISCLHHQEECGTYPSRFWDDVGVLCQEALQVNLRRGGPGLLPPPDAFADVKQAAAQKGYKTVAVLLDEAQAFFPARNADSFRARLKELLEQHWMLAQGNQGVAVVLGMVGLPSLSQRAGGDVMGVLQPRQSSKIDEEDLNSLILRYTQLQTTKAARVELARQSRNLYILRTLLERLIQVVARQSRNWANVVDVQGVSERLRHSLENGEESGVESYLRDALNDADSVNEWEPNAALPIAIALAVEEAKGARLDQDAFQRCRGLLDSWCGSASEGLIHLGIPEKRFSEHLRTLAERDVFAQGKFTSDLLAAWLLGLYRAGFSGRSDSDVVMRAATLRVRRPKDLEPMSEGGQAQLYLFTDEERNRFALREARLDTPDQLERFVQSAEALRRLTTEKFNRSPGAQYVLDLREIGLSADDDHLGFMVYRWIEGADMEASLGLLPPVLVADLGWRLCSALNLLHENNVLHRDIRPRNVILAEDEEAPAGFRPVLIDFGLARLEGKEMNTRVGPEYSAPEVQCEAPVWTRAADTFALGRLLGALMDPADPQRAMVRKVIDAMTCSRPADRVALQEAAARLRDLDKTLKLTDRTAKAWAEIEDLCGPDLEQPQFASIVKKFRNSLEGLAIGHHQNAFEKCADLANLANQVLEAFHPDRGLKWALADPASPLRQRPELKTLLTLRNYRSHGGIDLSQRLRRTETQVLGDTQAGLAALGKYLKVDALGRIGARFAASGLRP
jgi:hypothetical protein